MTCAQSGSLSIEIWMDVLDTPIKRITWNFIDDYWRLKCIMTWIFNKQTDHTSTEKVLSILNEVLDISLVIVSEHLKIHTITRDNKISSPRFLNALKNLVGSPFCVANTLASSVNEFFTYTSVSNNVLVHTRKITTYFTFQAIENFCWLKNRTFK